jgi:hypothetical protein
VPSLWGCGGFVWEQSQLHVLGPTFFENGAEGGEPCPPPPAPWPTAAPGGAGRGALGGGEGGLCALCSALCTLHSALWLPSVTLYTL